MRSGSKELISEFGIDSLGPPHIFDPIKWSFDTSMEGRIPCYLGFISSEINLIAPGCCATQKRALFLSSSSILFVSAVLVLPAMNNIRKILKKKQG